MESLDGQAAIVTGAARGIGLAIAAILGREGARVLIADRDLDALKAAEASLQDQGIECLASRSDVTVRGDLESMAAAATDRWGRIDILAANAGIYPHIPLDELTEDQWDEIMAINVRGAVFATQICARHMITRGYGRIVLTSSITGSVVGQPGYSHYGATKAGLLGFMRPAALELAPHRITVNAVLPGNIATPGFADLGPEHQATMLAAIPVGFIGQPDDVGWAVRFLASPEAGYITGQTLIIDGGQILPEGA
jgi:3-oxoacyl-[acyl-carrier protein] reductase